VQGSSLPATALYYVNIWRGAGPDYQLSQLAPSQFLTPLAIEDRPLKPFHNQSSLMDAWHGPADAVQTTANGTFEEGICMADQSSTITDMCKRFAPHSFLDTTGPPYSYPWYDYATPPLPRDPFHTWAQSFVFWRGSRRLKLSSAPNFSIVPGGTSSSVGFANSDGGAIVLDSSSSTMSATIPWHSQAPFCISDTRLFQEPDPLNKQPIDGTSNVTGDTFWIAGGDDFLYLWPLPPIWAALQLFRRPTVNTSDSPKRELVMAANQKPTRPIEHIGMKPPAHT